MKYNKFVEIVGNPKIGKRTWIGVFSVIDASGGLEIGEECDIGSGTHIYTHDTVNRCINGFKFNTKGEVNRGLIHRKPVKIGNNVFIGANTTILKGVIIENKAVIGAGSVVLEGTYIKEKEMWAGNPARRLK